MRTLIFHRRCSDSLKTAVSFMQELFL